MERLSCVLRIVILGLQLQGEREMYMTNEHRERIVQSNTEKI